MDTTNAADFLSKLLNRQVSTGDRLKLSSAQRARFVSWLEQRGINTADTRLQRDFTVDALLPGGEGKIPAVAKTEPVAETSGSRLPLEVGIDIQTVADLRGGVDPLDLKANADLCALFTPRELSYAEARPDPLETLTGLYAAKEAIWKSSGGHDVAAKDLRTIEILPDEAGRPRARDFAVSISHSGGFAVAVACRAESSQPPAGIGIETVPARDALPRQAVAQSSRRHELYIALLLGLLVLLQGAVLVELVLHRH